MFDGARKHASAELVDFNCLRREPPPIHALHARAEPKSEPAARHRAVGGVYKRICDFVLSLTLAIALTPVLALIAFAICFETRGSPFFLQRRGGFRGKVFLVYKFRTMTSCDDGRAIDQAQQGDQRVTRVGAFLRKTSLDELPQLFNVLRGEMSLIGPRPHAVAHDRKFLEIDPDYRRRWLALPGVTGLAQVCGARGLTDTPEAVKRRIALDLKYVERWSPLLDAWILIKTPFLVFSDKNAF